MPLTLVVGALPLPLVFAFAVSAPARRVDPSGLRGQDQHHQVGRNPGGLEQGRRPDWVRHLRAQLRPSRGYGW